MYCCSIASYLKMLSRSSVPSTIGSIVSDVVVTARTGAEMEALQAASQAALTIIEKLLLGIISDVKYGK